YAKVAGDKASDLFKAAADAVSKLYGDAKSRLEIEKLGLVMNKKYRELGKLYFETKMSGAEPDLTSLMDELRILSEAVDALKNNEPVSKEAEEILGKADPADEAAQEAAENSYFDEL
ncbi:MAG: hypothetical protein J5822_00585, partial [Eubacteriaceae bacterium]|nr:hypothetical protein [Eubacteriaceae bacterium]